jgi:hypothetical protein
MMKAGITGVRSLLMRFMMMVKGNACSESGQMPPPELMAAIGKLSEEAVKSGLMVDSGGLLPSSCGALVQVQNGEVTVTDGPFPETKEVIGGYAIFNLESKEQALKMAYDFMKLHRDILGPNYKGECEVRQMMDCAPAPQQQRTPEETLVSV